MNRTPPIVALVLLCALGAATCSDDGGENGAGGSSGGSGSNAEKWGFSAHDHVGPKFKKLVVEIDHVAGHAPGADTLKSVEQQLKDLVAGGYLAKPDGITIQIDQTDLTAGGTNKVWTFKELDNLARANRSVPLGAGESGIYALYVDGKFEDDTDKGFVLGFAYSGNWMVMLKDNVERSCDNSTLLNGPLLKTLKQKACDVTEARVFMHELGHLFGLVDNGVAMQTDHRDKEHGKHDSNSECLMYWLNETQSAADVVAERFKGGDQSTGGFDAECLADLKAVASP